MSRQSRQNAGSEQSRLAASPAPNPLSAETPTEIWIPAQPPADKGNGWPTAGKLILGGGLILFITAVLIAIGFLGQLFYFSELIFPGVQVLGIDVGSLTKAEAENVLEQNWAQQSLLLTYEEGVWPVGVTDLGLLLDAPATVQEAYEQGRTLSSLQRILLGGGQIQPKWTIDPAVTRAFLNDFSIQVNVPAVDAGVQIRQGEVIETFPADGRALDLEMTSNHLQENAAQVLASGRLPLIMQPVPPAITDTSRLAEEARRLLSTTVTLQAYDPIADETFEWAISPAQWGSWMTLKSSAAAGSGFEWVVDEEAAQAFLTNQLSTLGEGRYLDTAVLIPELVEAITTQQSVVGARIYHTPRRHIVQSGETYSSIGRDYGIPYPWIQQANPDSENLFAGNEIIIPSPDEMLPLPVVPNKRIIVSISQQRAWVYEDGQVKWEWPASTGIDSSPTAPGIFQIQSHEPNAYASNWDLWMPNFMGVYRPIPTSDFMNGFHGFPTRNGTTLLWTGDLGHQVTYGCILLSSENAAQLYEWAEDGVVVEVQP